MTPWRKRALIGLAMILAVVLGLVLVYTLNRQTHESESNPTTSSENNGQATSKNPSSQKADFRADQPMTIAEEQMRQLMILPDKLSREDLRYHLYKENGWLFFFNNDYSDARYVLMQKGNIQIVGEKENFQKEYGQDMTVKDVTFTPTLDQFAFVVSSKEKAFIVLNGEKMDQDYAAVYDVRFSPDGKQFGYIARKDDGTLVGVVDGQETLLTDEDTESVYYKYTSQIFSPDSNKVAYFVNYNPNTHRNPYKAFVLIDGQKFGGYAFVDSFTFSPDGSRYAFEARKGNVSEVVVDGKVQSGYEYTGHPVFSYDGKHVAYSTQNEMREDLRKEFIIFDGQETQTHPRIADVMFVPKGYEIGYRYCNGSWGRGESDCYVVVGNVKSEALRNLGELEAIDSKGRPIFTTVTEEPGEGEMLTYYSLNHKGKTSKVYDSIFGAISLPDYNDALVFAATEHLDKYVSGKSFIVVDNNESANRFDRIWPPKIATGNTVTYAALSGTTLYQVQAVIRPNQ